MDYVEKTRKDRRWAGIGFLVAVLWLVVWLCLFDARMTPWLHYGALLAVITCPPFLLTPLLDVGAWLLAPFLNALLYFFISSAITDRKLEA